MGRKVIEQTPRQATFQMLPGRRRVAIVSRGSRQVVQQWGKLKRALSAVQSGRTEPRPRRFEAGGRRRRQPLDLEVLALSPQVLDMVEIGPGRIRVPFSHHAAVPLHGLLQQGLGLGVSPLVVKVVGQSDLGLDGARMLRPQLLLEEFHRVAGYSLGLGVPLLLIQQRGNGDIPLGDVRVILAQNFSVSLQRLLELLASLFQFPLPLQIGCQIVVDERCPPARSARGGPEVDRQRLPEIRLGLLVLPLMM